jgi:hypothetical protein
MIWQHRDYYATTLLHYNCLLHIKQKPSNKPSYVSSWPGPAESRNIAFPYMVSACCLMTRASSRIAIILMDPTTRLNHSQLD